MAVTISSSTTYTLQAAEDNLTLTGTANINGFGNSLANIINGNTGANILKGYAGADQLYGGAGNDTLYAGDAGSTGNTLVDKLYGGTGNDILYADGNDQLYGQAGNDTLNAGTSTGNTLFGDAGDDLYIIDNAYNSILEIFNNGVDTLQTSLTVNLNSPYSGFIVGAINTSSEIEKVILTGSLNTDAYGNALTNTLTGNTGNNKLLGGLGADTINGGAGNDTLYADNADNALNTSKDYLNGGMGDDVYYMNGNDYAQEVSGGAGNDTYIVTGLGNQIIDASGVDTVKSDVSFSNQFLPSFVGGIASGGIEVIELTGSLNIDAIGSALSLGGGTETLRGNSGNNVLEGSGGNDIVEGGAGNDTLVVYADVAPTQTMFQKYALATGKMSLTGGADQDTFWIGKAYLGNHSSGLNQLTLTDFTHGVDTLRLGISTTASAPTVLNTLTATASDTLTTLLNKASLAGSATAPVLTQFAFAGNTYLVLDQNSATTFTASTDLAISLTGTPGLTLSDVVFAAV